MTPHVFINIVRSADPSWSVGRTLTREVQYAAKCWSQTQLSHRQCRSLEHQHHRCDRVGKGHASELTPIPCICSKIQQIQSGMQQMMGYMMIHGTQRFLSPAGLPTRRKRHACPFLLSRVETASVRTHKRRERAMSDEQLNRNSTRDSM